MAPLPFAAGPPPAIYAHSAAYTKAGQRYPAAAAGLAAAKESKREEPFPFTRLEVAAIRIGESDPLSFLGPGSRVPRLLRDLFGSQPPNPLADERLEALRLVVIALRQQRRRSPAGAIETALAAGIPQSQLDALAAELRSATAS